MKPSVKQQQILNVISDVVDAWKQTEDIDSHLRYNDMCDILQKGLPETMTGFDKDRLAVFLSHILNFLKKR